MRVPKLIRVTTVPMALKVLLRGQMKHMKNEGLDVIMVSADGKEREDVMQYEECDHYIIPMTRKITPFADLVSLWRLYLFFRKQKPDIVHSHTPKAGMLAMLASKLAGVKIRVHTIAGLRFMTSEGITRKILQLMEKLTGKWATHVWVNSNSLLAYVRNNKLVSERKTEVIGFGSTNGINLQRFSANSLDPDKLQGVKEIIAYDDTLTYFLCVGRIVKDKGISELAAAFEKLYRQNSNVRLILVGSFEDDLDPISDEVRNILKTHPGIILAGWNDDVEYFMHLSFALVHPSYREGFPNVLLQAGAMFCPVICSRIEGNIDIVDDEQTGLLFEAKHADSLLAAMQKALFNSAALQQYAKALRSKIEEYFDQSQVHGLLEKRYQELLDKVVA